MEILISVFLRRNLEQRIVDLLFLTMLSVDSMPIVTAIWLEPCLPVLAGIIMCMVYNPIFVSANESVDTMDLNRLHHRRSV